MHLGIPALLDFYRQHKDEEALVLATIEAVEGSTYRKPGAMMLASRDGCHAGMISGGCLEGDLMHHASAVFEDGEPRAVTYDMHADDELVWGLGLGCDGIIHLRLQRLQRSDGFGFLTALSRAWEAGRASLLALDYRGACALLDSAGVSHVSGAGGDVLLEALKGEAAEWPAWRFRRQADAGRMMIGIPPITRVLVCGAGPDALPVVRQLRQLDWQVTIVDHRAAFARADRFPEGCIVVQCRPQQLPDKVPLAGLDAVVIMSHHLENDATWLAQLGPFDPAYIGALGPRARRDRLCEMAGVDSARVHGPAGLDIAAELPEAIALSIVAEIHAELNGRDGQSLTLRE